MSGYVSLFNASSRFSDADLQNALPDLQSQVSNEFLYFWGLTAYLDINGGGMPITIVDYPGANDPQGALGYHYVDQNYQPYAVIFAGLCQDYGYSVTGVISHELLEMMADTEVNNCNLLDNGNGTGFIVIQEVCDPCELSLYYEAPNGTVVSDFALPGWWVPGYPYQVDFLGLVPGPLQLLSGGYISYQQVTLSGWQQATADKLQAAGTVVKGGDPRLDVRGRLRLGQKATAPQPVTARTKPDPVNNQTGAGPRRQAAQQADNITVVKREDVPAQGQPGRHASASGVAPDSTVGHGPRAQTVHAALEHSGA